MFRIINKEELARDVTRIRLEAPQIAKKAMPGQFVTLLIEEKGERIPLTLADWDRENGTVDLIFQEVGFTTKKLGMLNKGDYIQHILGPLGHATEIRKLGRVVCIGGGVGIAEVYPVSRAFKEAGNYVIGIIGARSKDLLILENQMKEACDELFVATDDGSYGRKGFVTDVLKEILNETTRQRDNELTKLVYAIGPIPMMKAVSEMTRPHNIKTIVSVNPIMVDATGMCGSCRCRVGGKTVFACVEGPDFDGHQVDFDELQKRSKLFIQQEKVK